MEERSMRTSDLEIPAKAADVSIPYSVLARGRYPLILTRPFYPLRSTESNSFSAFAVLS